MVRNRGQQLGLHARRNPRDQADQRVPDSYIGLVHEAKEITPELLRVEAHSEVLYAQSALPVDNRGEERVIHVAVFGLVANTP